MATQKLLECIRMRCCGNALPPKGRSVRQNKQNYIYIDEITEKPELKTFSGTFTQFNKDVIVPHSKTEFLSNINYF